MLKNPPLPIEISIGTNRVWRATV